MKNKEFEIRLTKEEALVLFEFLSRTSDTDLKKIQYKSEKRVLWDLEADLEKLLSEIFSNDYTRILEHARRTVGG